MSRVYPLMSIVGDFTQGPPNLPGNTSVALLPSTAAGNNPVCRGWSTTRGRQYELDVVQAGTASLDVVDPAEWLNPVNAGSPWNSGANSLLPYRCTQIAAWWNPASLDVSGNMLNAANFPPGGAAAQAYDPSFETSFAAVTTMSGSPALVINGVHFFRGSKSLAVTPGGVGDTIGLRFWTVPGQLYTASTYVWVPTGCTVAASFVNYPGSVGTVIASQTSASTGAWVRLTMTGLAIGAVSALTVRFASGTPAQFWVDAVQVELGGAASTWTASGPTYFEVYTGYVERYPQQWDSQGFRGLKPLEAVDGLSVLSRTIIRQSYAATALADGPAVFVPYNDDAFPQTVQRPTGGQPYVGYQAIGSQSASVSFGGDTFNDGSKAVTLSQQNADPLTSNDNTQVTRLGTRYGSLMMDPQAFTFEVWIRWTAGQTWFGAGSSAAGESTTDPTIHDGPSNHFGVRSFQNQLAWEYVDGNNVSQLFSLMQPSSQKTFVDPNWHHLVFCGTGSNTWRGARDNVLTTGSYGSPTPPMMRIDNIYHYVNTYYGDIISTASFANLAMYNFTLSTAQVAAHYQRGIGYLGEKSGARALRLLTQYWSTNIVTDTGKTSMAADFSYSGRSMLDVLQEIAETESGLVWVDSAGLVHQDSRETRYTAATSATSQFTFGENTGAGELPYEELEYDYDPTYVYSEADLTAGGSGLQLPPVINATSQAAYGQRILSKTLQMQNDWDVNQAGQYFVRRYAKPAGAAGTGTPPRISKMTLNPAANPALFAAVLSMDIGTRITVKRRTNAVTISGDYYIEQVNHDASGDASSWKTDLQLSPVFVSQPWILGDAVKGVLGSTTVCVY